jgi:hypothetical protein
MAAHLKQVLVKAASLITDMSVKVISKSMRFGLQCHQMGVGSLKATNNG